MLSVWLASAASGFADFLGLSVIIPTLPYFLENSGYDPAFASVIISAQFYTICVGHICLGLLSDRFGPRRVLPVVMILDAVCFFSTGLAKTPVSLLIIRLITGFCSPAVPGIAIVLLECSHRELPTAISRLVFCNTFGMSIGPIISAPLYPVIGWLGINTVPAVAATIASGIGLVMSRMDCRVSTEHREQSHPGVKPTGRRRIASVHFVTFCGVMFVLGFTQNSLIVLQPYLYKEQFGLALESIGNLMLAGTAVVLADVAIFRGLPRLMGRHRHAVIRRLLSFLMCALFSGQSVASSNIHSFVVMQMISWYTFVNLLMSVQPRLQQICTHHAPESMGLLNAIQRVCFAFGQATGPMAIIRIGAHFGWWAPYLFLGALLLVNTVGLLPVMDRTLINPMRAPPCVSCGRSSNISPGV